MMEPGWPGMMRMCETISEKHSPVSRERSDAWYLSVPSGMVKSWWYTSFMLRRSAPSSMAMRWPSPTFVSTAVVA